MTADRMIGRLEEGCEAGFLFRDGDPPDDF